MFFDINKIKIMFVKGGTLMFFFIAQSLLGQQCGFTLSGKITDLHDGPIKRGSLRNPMKKEIILLEIYVREKLHLKFPMWLAKLKPNPLL